jgi:hypothetical protein
MGALAAFRARFPGAGGVWLSERRRSSSGPARAAGFRPGTEPHPSRRPCLDTAKRGQPHRTRDSRRRREGRGPGRVRLDHGPVGGPAGRRGRPRHGLPRGSRSPAGTGSAGGCGPCGGRRIWEARPSVGRPSVRGGCRHPWARGAHVGGAWGITPMSAAGLTPAQACESCGRHRAGHHAAAAWRLTRRRRPERRRIRPVPPGGSTTASVQAWSCRW